MSRSSWIAMAKMELNKQVGTSKAGGCLTLAENKIDVIENTWDVTVIFNSPFGTCVAKYDRRKNRWVCSA